MTYAYVYNAYSDPVENADADHQHDRQLRKASMKYVNEKRELQINAAILRATTHTNSRHPSPFKIKTNPGVDALAKEAQKTTNSLQGYHAATSNTEHICTTMSIFSRILKFSALCYYKMTASH